MSESNLPELEEAKALFRSNPARFVEEGLRSLRSESADTSAPELDIDALIADFFSRDNQEEIDITTLTPYTRALAAILNGENNT